MSSDGLSTADSQGKQVTCPLCGGLVEAPNPERLIELAGAHTLQAHGYRLPPAHVYAAMEDIHEDL